MPSARWSPLSAVGLVLGAALWGPGAARAQDASQAVSTRALDQAIHERLALEQYVAQVVAPLRAADVAGDGLDAGDLETRRQTREAQQRSQFISEVMRFDLNADLVVTPEEVATVKSATDRDGLRNELERYDGDGDGSVTVKEVLEASVRIIRIGRINRARAEDDVEALMALPEARDGRLTAVELADAARAAFARVDTDGDGRISREEAERLRASFPKEPRRQPVEDIYCAMPKAEAGDLLVLFGAYEGEYARATGAPQTGRATLRIAPGRQPLYLVLPSYRAIRWNLTGAVGRVRHVVVTSHEDAAKDTPRGADGLPPPRVRTFGAHGCVGYFAKLESPEAEAAKAAIALRLGRQPDLMVGSYTASNAILPPPPPGSEPRQRAESAGPLMRPGAWRFNDEAGDMPTFVVGEQAVTQLIFRVGDGICMAKFRWRREDKDVWRFQSRCGSDEWEQVAEGRAVGDFQTSLSFTARVVTRGFKNPAENGEATVRVQAHYVGPS